MWSSAMLEVVNRLREDETVDLLAALTPLRDAVPSPAIHVVARTSPDRGRHERHPVADDRGFEGFGGA